MSSRNLVVLTRLTPPRLNRRILHRARVSQRLLESLEYRLTIVQAGAGYGKSTALASLSDSQKNIAWYHLTGEDSDPVTFFLHLIHACRSFIKNPDSLITFIENQSSNLVEINWTDLTDELVNQISLALKEPALLILDDYHQIADSPHVPVLLDRLISIAPADLHFILASRYPVRLPSLSDWNVRGEVLWIDQKDLAFTPQEITELFHQHYTLALSQEEITSLAMETEGWAIALQLFWQGIKSGSGSSLRRRQTESRLSAEELFFFLAKEVLGQLSPDVQDFLLTTAVLRDLDTQICNCLRQEEDSDKYLKYLLENGLFVVDLGPDTIRYHNLFREFILNQLSLQQKKRLHLKAAGCHLNRGSVEAAVYHFLKAGQEDEAAKIISQNGESLILSGRLETLNNWITSISPNILAAHPLLLVFLGDNARLHSRFQEALGWYRQAEEQSRFIGDTHTTSQALHGQAKVYLDTVNPIQADLLLQEALKLVDGTGDRENRARLLELLAENKLNSGQPGEAESYHKKARELREIAPGETELSVRVLLRTGKLEQARKMLEARVITEKHEPFPTARAHRETLLLLALILEFQGEWEAAYEYAREGITRGEALQSPFVVAVGKMRLGHAALLRDTHPGYLEAVEAHNDAIRLADSLSVPRLKVEAFWGLVRAYGFKGELDLAEKAAAQGLEQGRLAGDEWISALILVSMGASYALSGKTSLALDWLDRAREKFYKVSDPYGETLARFWQCLTWWKSSQYLRLDKNLDDVLRLIHEHGYEYLLTRRTLLGPPQPRAILPMLLYARKKGFQRPFIETILFSLGISSIEYHPGYQLRVQTLGQFRAWRGDQEISPAEWRREKSRQLFQLLMTHRCVPVERDRLVESLWPGVDIETGRRNFRVTLSTLLRVLVPSHTREEDSIFIFRDGTQYALRSNTDIWVDAWEFERLVELGQNQPASQRKLRIQHFQNAQLLYKGEYLQDNLYEDWCIEERERLLAIYLRTSDQLACLFAENEDWQAVLDTCQRILARDKCWEEAYRLMILAYHKQGNQPSALRAYQKCVETLKTELDIQPSQETVSLFNTIFPEAPSN